MRCPKCCQVLTLVESDGVRYRQCTGCFGCCVGEVGLKRLTRLEALKTKNAQPAPMSSPQAALSTQTGEASLADLAVLVSESNTRKDLRCPSCEAVMRKSKVHPMVPVQIDMCPKCKSAWLDAGEMKLIQKLYSELQNSDDPQIVALREKIGRVGLQWEERRRETNESRQQIDTISGDIESLFRIWVGR